VFEGLGEVDIGCDERMKGEGRPDLSESVG
jgi:hypothetical protein